MSSHKTTVRQNRNTLQRQNQMTTKKSDNIPMRVGDYIRKKKIGAGEFGSVYSAYHKDDPSDEVALKKICQPSPTAGETSVYASLRKKDCRYLCQYIQAFQSGKNSRDLVIAVELCTGGDLQHVSSNFAEAHPDAGYLPEGRIKQLSWEILVGISNMHIAGYVHCDLKLANILLTAPIGNGVNTTPRSIQLKDYGYGVRRNSEGVVYCESRIADFGLTKRIGSIEPGIGGTLAYMAPEIWRNKEDGVRKERDLWAFGLILYRLLTGRSPWPSDRRRENYENGVFYENLKLEFPTLPVLSHNAKDLVQKLLEKDSLRRISAQEALNHPWYQENEINEKHTIVTSDDTIYTTDVSAVGQLLRNELKKNMYWNKSVHLDGLPVESIISFSCVPSHSGKCNDNNNTSLFLSTPSTGPQPTINDLTVLDFNVDHYKLFPQLLSHNVKHRSMTAGTTNFPGRQESVLPGCMKLIAHASPSPYATPFVLTTIIPTDDSPDVLKSKVLNVGTLLREVNDAAPTGTTVPLIYVGYCIRDNTESAIHEEECIAVHCEGVGEEGITRPLSTDTMHIPSILTTYECDNTLMGGKSFVVIISGWEYGTNCSLEQFTNALSSRDSVFKDRDKEVPYPLLQVSFFSPSSITSISNPMPLDGAHEGDILRCIAELLPSVKFLEETRRNLDGCAAALIPSFLTPSDIQVVHMSEKLPSVSASVEGASPPFSVLDEHGRCRIRPLKNVKFKVNLLDALITYLRGTPATHTSSYTAFDAEKCVEETHPSIHTLQWSLGVIVLYIWLFTRSGSSKMPDLMHLRHFAKHPVAVSLGSKEYKKSECKPVHRCLAEMTDRTRTIMERLLCRNRCTLEELHTLLYEGTWFAEPDYNNNETPMQGVSEGNAGQDDVLQESHTFSDVVSSSQMICSAQIISEMVHMDEIRLQYKEKLLLLSTVLRACELSKCHNDDYTSAANVLEQETRDECLSIYKSLEHELSRQVNSSPLTQDYSSCPTHTEMSTAYMPPIDSRGVASETSELSHSEVATSTVPPSPYTHLLTPPWFVVALHSIITFICSAAQKDVLQPGQCNEVQGEEGNERNNSYFEVACSFALKVLDAITLLQLSFNDHYDDDDAVDINALKTKIRLLLNNFR